MPKKEKTRRLWLNVTARNVSHISKRKFIERLLDSIDKGDYKVPDSWGVVLHWRNSEMADMKSGDWQEEMENSAGSSDGWDLAVSSWLEAKLRRV